MFINVSKGQVANSDDLNKAFGKTDVNEIVKEASNVFSFLRGPTFFFVINGVGCLVRLAAALNIAY